MDKNKKIMSICIYICLTFAQKNLPKKNLPKNHEQKFGRRKKICEKTSLKIF